MTDLRKVVQQALEALSDCIEKFYAMRSIGVIDALPLQAVSGAQAITALRAALAQPDVVNAMSTVIAAMQADPDYAWSWHCNVAMAFVDAGGDSYTANQGAARFMRTLAQVEPAHELPAQPDVPEGYVLVPVEPTEEMAYAGARSIIEGREKRPGVSWAEEAQMAYAAMLAAAPKGTTK